MRLLLINPRLPESYWSFSWILENVMTDKKAMNPPLGLATLAALTPPHWDVTIVDENVEEIDWDRPADVVGVCGMQVQFGRQKEVLDRFRRRGVYVVAGGSYASLCPEEYSGLADTTISGEAEYIWPRFCADFEDGRPQRLYRETGEVSLRDSPPPRFDLLKTDLYSAVSLQFSRGCPFRCEFCDIIVMFGRKPRTKGLEQVERELDLLRGMGVRNVFFVDDNLIGHLPDCRRLLAFLADYQKRHAHRFTFGAEVSINVTSDSELLRLFQEANFAWFFTGIESPSEASLQETRKEQNTRADLLTSVRILHSFGIEVLAGYIVGFDSDDLTIFDRQFRFIVESGIIVSMIALLAALPKTPLYERLERAGRLRSTFAPDNTLLATNIVPLQMSYDELLSGYADLQRRLTRDKAIYERIRNKFRFFRNPPTFPHVPRTRLFLYMARLFFRGILKGGWTRLYYFLRSLGPAIRQPKRLLMILSDWTVGVSLERFVSRFAGPGVRQECDRPEHPPLASVMASLLSGEGGRPALSTAPERETRRPSRP